MSFLSSKSWTYVDLTTFKVGVSDYIEAGDSHNPTSIAKVKTRTTRRLCSSVLYRIGVIVEGIFALHAEFFDIDILLL